MDDIDEFPINQLVIGVDLKFNAIRVVEDNLIPVRFKVATDLQPYQAIGDEDADLARSQFVYEKIKYFVKEILENSIIASHDNTWAMDRFLTDEGLPVSDNNVVLLPSPTTNAGLAHVLQCKFRALGKGDYDFGYIQITSSDYKGLAFTHIGEPSEYLPEMEDWIGEHSWFKKPWWHRDDASTLDIVPDEDADLASPPSFAYSLSFVGDNLRRHEPAKILRPEFRPRIIQGGKID